MEEWRSSVPPTPEKYQFRRRNYYKSKGLAKDVADRRYGDSADQSRDRMEYNIDTPKTYHYTRLSIGRRKSNIDVVRSPNESDDVNVNDFNARGPSAPVIHPKSYQFSTMYRRADPAGTYRAIQSPPLHTAKFSDSDAKPASYATCDCLFFLYNGFCQGHAPATPYYNVRSSLDRRLVKWTDNALRNDNCNNEDYNRWY